MDFELFTILMRCISSCNTQEDFHHKSKEKQEEQSLIFPLLLTKPFMCMNPCQVLPPFSLHQKLEVQSFHWQTCLLNQVSICDPVSFPWTHQPPVQVSRVQKCEPNPTKLLLFSFNSLFIVFSAQIQPGFCHRPFTLPWAPLEEWSR